VFKYEGYLRALEEAEIEVNEDYIIKDGYSYEAGIAGVSRILDLAEKPTAVFVATDEMALGVIHGAQDKGFNIPEDLEVFGFNNTRLATMVRPTLSTVIQPMYDLGAVAMRLLTKYMDKEEDAESKVILLHRIVERY